MRVLKPMMIVVCCTAAVLPAIVPARDAGPKPKAYPYRHEYPCEVSGLNLWAMPISKLERAFAEDFPGWTGHFTDGRREIVLRRVTRGTRLLHSSSYCFRGAGFEVRPLPMLVDEAGRIWSRFEASREINESVQRTIVRERIVDGAGNAWTDPSAWYYAALLERTRGPWWAVTFIEPDAQ